MLMIHKNKYRILILSNPNNEEYIEDKYIATAFEKDGQEVTLKWVDYAEELDEKFDIIIRRNTWVESEDETREYKTKNDKMVERLKNKNIKTVNLEGLDGTGKEYLCKLFGEGKKVIPTIDDIEDLNKFEKVEEYVLKDNNSFGSGLGQKIIKSNEIHREFKKGYLIQPKLEFKSELLEIEDNSPHMNLEKLGEDFRDEVLNEYKRNIYEYLEKNYRCS